MAWAIIPRSKGSACSLPPTVSIGLYERYYPQVKIGITSNPERCAGIMTKKYLFR